MLKQIAFIVLVGCSSRLLAASDQCTTAALSKQMQEIAAVTGGPVGAAAMIIENGTVASLNGKQRFPMQSVYKLPIGMAVLGAVEAGQLTLDRKVRVTPEDLAPPPLHSPIRDENPDGNIDMTVDELLNAMIMASDGTASDVLLRVLGGPQHAADFVHKLGVKEMEIATTEAEMAGDIDAQYRNSATPEAAVKLLATLQKGGGISEANRGHLLLMMTQTPIGPKRLKGDLPPGTSVAHKTGSSGTIEGITRATNDIGIITLPDGRHLAVAVFVSDTKADEKTREGVISKIARAAWDCYSGKSE